MADIKARIPKELSDEKYDEWFTGFVTWYLALPDTPEYCNWLRDGLQDLDDDYFAKRIAAQQADDAQMDASAAWRSSVKALRLLLIKLRISLLSLVPGDDSVLHLFRLDKEVPEDPDKLIDYATIADLAWQPHAGEAEYEVFEDRLNNIAPFCDDVKAKRIAMRQAITAYSHATDEKTAAREACNTRERAIFSFFRGEDLPDGFWTDSQWGLPSGGDGEEPGPEPPENWDEAPTGFTVTKSIGNSIEINCVKHPDADGINVYHAEGPFGDDTVQPRPGSPAWEAIEALPLMVDVAYNKRHWLWVCAVKDGVEGDFAGPLWVEFKEE